VNHPRANNVVIWIANLQVSTLFLYRAQLYRGYCILRFEPWDATSLDTLSEAEYAAFCADLRNASQAIRAAVEPDHMNYELLGNSDPHLHWHIVPRYKTDPRWGGPIWEGRAPSVPEYEQYALSEPEYADLVARIGSHLL
jgi:diadenosine tetraphosphate (Ap4A) HIT family hydrolase